MLYLFGVQSLICKIERKLQYNTYKFVHNTTTYIINTYVKMRSHLFL